MRHLALVLFLAACGGAAAQQNVSTALPPSTAAISPEAKELVSAGDRTAEDRKLDAGRRPGELLTFIGVKPGMKVADLGAGYGYTTELLARAVGPSGVVYMQNTPWLIEKFGDKGIKERLARPVNSHVVRVDRSFDDPLPPEATDLDLVIDVLFYHDTVWLKADRDKMNAAVFKALKSGGHYVIVDHSGRPGTGTTETDTLHRIEEKVVRAEVEKAGFKLEAEGDFLKNPGDTRDWNAAPMGPAEKRGTSDRFVLKYVKP
jgi:predicted methyltransferase